jgi:aryl sulfotransferase
MSDNRPRYRSVVYDSIRWDGFQFRPGDIVICTPPKCGTTWMQMICALLIFQDPNLDRPLSDISPWLDMLVQTKDEAFGQLSAQKHRRFIKTHTPLDGLPMDDRVTYICVGRDPRDVAISMFNHSSNMEFTAIQATIERVTRLDGIEAPASPGPPASPPAVVPTLEDRFWGWIGDPTPAVEKGSSLLSTLHHFDTALRSRDWPNVVVMHYGDLKIDLEGEMRHLAARLEIEVPEQNWPALVEAASFDRMRGRANELAPNANQNVWKDPAQFFHSGTGGHWREFFGDTGQQRYEARLSELAGPCVTDWAHYGWLGGDRSPGGASRVRR